mgnify:CR=1 FL=1
MRRRRRKAAEGGRGDAARPGSTAAAAAGAPRGCGRGACPIRAHCRGAADRQRPLQGRVGPPIDPLGYTQSAISQQIAALERVVGERLIDRPVGPRRVALTDAGSRLLEHATAIMARLAAAEADLEALSRGERGVLLLTQGELDLAFASLPLPDGPFAVAEALVDPTDAALAGPAGRRIVPQVVFRSDHNSTVQGLAAAGLGAALLPRLAYDSSDPYNEAIELGTHLPPRVISLV